MTLEVKRPHEFLDMVNTEKGLVDRGIFSDPEIYHLELERIFARAWNFMCHESQIPNPGDFFMTYIGEDRVIVVRDNDGLPQVLVNSCRHRGNAVCRAEEGHATSFMCTYHGWTYDLKGALVGVPGFKEVYHEELDRENWGLIKAAQVDCYHGFIFANMDAEAIPLHEYLGDPGRIGLDLVASRGEMAVIAGIQKYTIPCNWKFATDNVWDFYHGITHSSASMSGYMTHRRRILPLGMKQRDPRQGLFSRPNRVLLSEYGHVVGGPLMNPENPHEQAEDAPWTTSIGPTDLQIAGHPNIFPNMWLTTNQVSLRIPKGPSKTEIWWFTLLNKDLPPDIWQAARFRAGHTFGPAGMLEQDDGENWGQSTRGMTGTVSKRFPINYSMHVGKGDVISDELSPPRIETSSVTEHPQLWHYRSWSEWMAATSWGDLKRNHSRVPDKV